MKIIKLQAENIKRLVAVEITPDGALVQITGKNGNGKTSVLDSIWWALEGADHIQKDPIRHGADKAIIKLDLGEFVVTRKFARKEEGGFTTSMNVENADGVRVSSPQAVIDGLLGALTFDPLSFSREKPADQFNILRGLIPGIDFAANDKADAKEFQERQDINRRVKELKAQIDGIVLPEGLPTEPVDIEGINAILAKATEHNAGIQKRVTNRANLARTAATLRDEGNEKAELAQTKRAQSAKLLEEAEALETESAEMIARAEADNKRIAEAPTLPEPIDTAAVTEQLAAAHLINAAVTKATEKAELEARLERLEAASAALTKSMADRKEATEKAIQAANLPVAGIGFGDGFVTLAGVPFEQGSDAERLRASLALAMALNPKLRVIRIREGSLLDEDGLKLVAEAAEAADMQVWIERVESSGKVGFTLVDGQVVAHDGAPVAQPSATITPTPAAAKPASKGAAAAKAAIAAAAPPAAAPATKPSTLGDEEL